MDTKLASLKGLINNYKSAVVAFSGGVDSTFLLKVTVEQLGNNVLAIIGKSATYPEEELNAAIELASSLNSPFLIIETDEMSNPKYIQNSPDRCYFCKLDLFGKIKKIALEKGFDGIFDGTNADDDNDYRPGRKAAVELGVFSPLKEAGLTKEEIRTYSKVAGLPTWNKPSMACLASRFPYGDEISQNKLKMVECAEKYIRNKGFNQVRVRIHNYIARIEIEKNQISNLVEEPCLTDIYSFLKDLGFTYITLDLNGFQSGSMNATLPEVHNE